MVSAQIISKVIASKSMDLITGNGLTKDYFIEYEEEYEFIVNHYTKYNVVPDAETFIHKFKEFKLFDVSESDRYLITKIQEEYTYSRLVPILRKVNELMQSDSVQALDYMKIALSEFKTANQNIGVDIISRANERYDEYESKRSGEKVWMYPTGFKELDDIIFGLAIKEELMVVFARTGIGKSWFLNKVVTHNWKVSGVNVGYVSPEMSANKVGYRFDTLNEHFSNFNLYSGKDVGDYDRYIEHLVNGSKDGTIKNKFIVATTADFENRVTVSKLKKWCLDNDIKILAIDGIKYMTDERSRKGDNLTTALTNVSEDLISLSLAIQIPIIVVVQANRSGAFETNTTPSLESIRDSDGIAHNATKVISLSQKQGKLIMSIEKNRDGKNGVKLVYDWDIDTGTFEYDSNGNEYIEQQEQQDTYNVRKAGRTEQQEERATPRRATVATPF